MEDIKLASKPWYESMTIRNSIFSMIAIGATIGASFGYDFDPEQIKDGVDKLFIGVTGAVALYANLRAIIGRLKATTSISDKI